MKILAPKNDNEDIIDKKYVDDALSGKQATLVSGTNIKTVNNQNILGSGNINIEAEVGSNVEQKHRYVLNGTPFYYQFYGVSSIDGITVNVGVEIDVVYATLVLIMQSIDEMKQGYSDTLSAIQGIHIPDNVYESSVLIIVIHNLGSMTCYIDPTTKYVIDADFVNFDQGYSVNFGENPYQLTVRYGKVTTIDQNSTDDEYPSAKAVYDYIQSLDASEVGY